jgi:imidazolonepropionase-like amidohydrolase
LLRQRALRIETTMRMNTNLAALAALLTLGAASLGAAPGEADLSAPADSTGRLAVRAGRLHTMAGPPLADTLVLIDGGSIVAIGAWGELEVPTDWPIVEAAVVTPGLVDAHCSLGLAGFLNTDHVNDEVDRSEPVQPELRAIDAYDLDNPLVGWVRSFGVTTVHTGHAPLALMPGQTMVAKTHGRTVADAVLVEEAMVAAVLGDGGRGAKGAPGTRAKSAAVLRKALLEGREQARKSAESDGDEPLTRDLRKEALARVVTGETPLLLTAHESRDLLTALRIASEFPDLRLVLDGASEAPQVIEQLGAAGVPVVLHPTMQRSGGEAENISMETARVLVEAGIPVALQSGYEGYVPRARVLLFEAAVAARYGLDRERALGLVTLDAARICGVDHLVGSLEVGKHGDLALFDGDPFEYTTHCVGTVIEGQVVSTGELWYAHDE